MHGFFDSDRRSYVAASVIYGLLCQTVFAPLATAVLLLAAGPTEAAASPGLRTIVICSGIGLARVTVDEDGQPVDAPDQPRQQTCVHCPSHAACLVPPVSMVAALRLADTFAMPQLPPRDAGLVAGLRQGPPPVRGPPLLLI